jgi:acylphosphatase
MSAVRTRLRYVGRVQGVGFRATARAVAAGFGVTGWVRNEADGSVTLEAQGEGGEVDLYLVALWQRMARNIESADRVEVAVLESESGFEVRR